MTIKTLFDGAQPLTSISNNNNNFQLDNTLQNLKMTNNKKQLKAV